MSRTTILASCVLLLSVPYLLVPAVLAQSLPTGAHYGGRPVDTGYGGVSRRGSGNYAASVPLDFPGDRAGLPIPLQVLQTGRGTGGAGLGWEVTLSYIHRDMSFARRRPRFGQNEAPQARPRLVLSLFGQQVELVKRDQTFWVARDGTLALTVQELSSDAWNAYDEDGRTYAFTNQPSTGLWLLTEIRTHGGAAVRLSYDITGENAREINLRRVEYNTDAAGGCAKHLLELEYGPAFSAPIGYSFLGGQLFSRSRTLSRINVNVRASLGASVAACNVPATRLKRYTFNYEQRDVDSQLPRLSSVTMTGREGTPEANQPLLVAAYEYGTAVKDDVVRFERTQTIALPTDADSATIAGSILGASSPLPGPGERYGMWQTLLDMTGDGRPELVYKQGDKLRIARNRPTSSGGTTIGIASGSAPGSTQLHDSTFSAGPLDAHSTTSRRLRYDAGTANTTDVWRRSMDVNGDGRIDIVDAGAEPKYWVVYLNTVGIFPGINWQKRKISTEALAQQLRSLGYELPNNDYVPLTRRISAFTSDKLRVCFRYQDGEWKSPSSNLFGGPSIITGSFNTEEHSSVTLTWKCEGGTGLLIAAPPSPNNPLCVSGYLNDGQTWIRGSDLCGQAAAVEKTYTLWDLTDLNGDGYPDFVFNDAPPRLRRDRSVLNNPYFLGPHADPQDPNSKPREGATFIGEIPVSFESGATKILAAFNVAGVRLANTGAPTQAFSSLIVFKEDSRGVGVGLWEDAPNPGGTGELQQQRGGLADVNGDGLADWVNQRTAFLGNGRRVTDTAITLPGPMSEQMTDRATACATGNTYRSWLTATLRDMTGDGMPDYVTRELWVGTGAGFAGPYAIDSDQNFSISTQIESCDGGASSTASGLFDVDGDGKADVVKLEGGVLQVWQLAGADSTRRGVNVGRLTSVDNGHGAKTRITYRSAKEDVSTAHQVPYPEIVVNTVATAGIHNLGGSIGETRYAYGGAKLYFDTTTDAFRFYGYDRVVAMRTGAGPDGRTIGYATIADNWSGPSPSLVVSSAEGRWLRYRRVGHLKESFTLRGTSDANPWNLLSVASNAPNVISATQVEWAAKRFEGQDSGGLLGGFVLPDCREIVKPYDWEASTATSGIDMCRAHGFGFVATTKTWYGAAPPSAHNLQTRSRVITVDDFGRVVSAQFENDLFRADDDLCVESTYADPVALSPRVLTAIASRRVASCDGRVVISNDSFLYDNLVAGAVREGQVTTHFTDQHATDTGERLRRIRVFDAIYDAAGNVATVQTARGGVSQSTAVEYDIFGVVPTHVKIAATDLPAMETAVTYDLVSLQKKSIKDIHGTQYGADYDGFGRLTRSTVKPPGGEEGVLSTRKYSGFSVLSSGGRRIEAMTYSNPVPPAAVTATPGRRSITYFDELGRARFTIMPLGTDYSAPALAVGARAYDDFGRISFEADAFPANISATANVVPVPNFLEQYGTSYHYKSTGDIDCLIQGQGRQARSSVSSLASELFKTCFGRTQRDHVDIHEVSDPESLLPNSVTASVVRRAYSTAIGRVIERTTEKDGVRLESAMFTQDRLGQLTSMTRYLDPVARTGGVRVRRRMDSLGQTLELTEALNAPRNFIYSEWGEPLETRWQDGTTEHRIVARFDALGRMISKEEVNNGVPDPETAVRYSYDTPMGSARFSPTLALGRLTRATSRTSAVDFSYDPYGRTNGLHFNDDDGKYIERMHYSADGSLELLEFNLPDNDFSTETVKYGYDSARRLRDVTFDDRTGNRILYQAREIDARGGVRLATFGGKINVSASFDNTGRQLPRNVLLHSDQGTRELAFTTYDAFGREIRRTESKDGQPAAVYLRFYDALGRLALASRGEGSSLSEAWQIKYDPLGNITQMVDVAGSNDASLGYGQIDPDRLCRIIYGDAAFTNGACNVRHDASGNIVSKPTRTEPITLSYFNLGNVRTITQGQRTARFAYDAFGQVHKLDISGSPDAGGRQDRRYGALLEKQTVGGVMNSILTRSIPGPRGVIAERKGAGQDWIFGFGELRGDRFFVDETGAFVQEVDYRPFGESLSSGAAVGTPDYSSEQWNGGEHLGVFGLSHLGARLYDPTIGRFMSRDPLFVPRGASTTNAYAFARNDPINRADPTGLDDALMPTYPARGRTQPGARRREGSPLPDSPGTPGGNPFLAPHLLNTGMTLRGSLFGMSPPPPILRMSSHAYRAFDAIESWRTYGSNPSRENLGYGLLYSTKFAAGFAGLWGSAINAGISGGIYVHERGWYTPYTWAEEENERQWFFHSQMLHELKGLNSILQEQLSDRTTCREAAVCWQEGAEPGYDYDGYDPISTELPFGPYWMPNDSPAGPVQPQLGPWGVSEPVTQTVPQVSRPAGGGGGGGDIVIVPGGCTPGDCGDDRP